MKEHTKGRVTIPTDLDVVPETLELLEKWGADAIRDCDGTDYPEELKNVDAKVYSTYYTTRKDNAWAKANPDEIQQMYIMTPFYTAVDEELSIHLMNHLYPDMLKVNDHDDITRWWEVIDRTTGEVVSPELWNYDSDAGDVTIHGAEPFHDYTVSFLPGAFHDVICGKCGKCGVLHKFSQDVHFLLQEKTGGRHLAAAQSVPESDLRVEKKGLSVQIL